MTDIGHLVRYHNDLNVYTVYDIKGDLRIGFLSKRPLICFLTMLRWCAIAPNDHRLVAMFTQGPTPAKVFYAAAAGL